MSPPADDDTQSALESITRGASLFLLGRIVAQGLTFGFNLLLTRALGAALYGIYAYAATLLSFAVILARAGTGQSLLRFVPANADNPSRQNAYVGLAYLTALVGSLIVGAALYLLAPRISAVTLESAVFVDVLRIFALVLPFNTLIKLTNAVFRALEALEYQVFVADLLQPLTNIAAVGAALLVGYSLLGVVGAIALGAVLVTIVSFTLLYTRTSLTPRFEPGRGSTDYGGFYNYSLPLTLKDLGSILYTRVDVLMVGVLLTGTAVGIYRVSVLVAGLLVLPLTAFNQLFPPVASRLYTRGQTTQLKSVYETVTRWTLALAIPPALVLGLYSAEVLAIFGSEFPAGATVLTLFAIGQLTNCAVGPSGFLLMMTDHQYLNLLNQWSLGVLNVVLNYVLILEFGFIGAALATVGVLVLINGLRLGEVWYTERLHPYSKAFWKPVVAGVGAGGVMAMVDGVFSGFSLLVVGATIGGIVFLTLLFTFGIEERDRVFYRETIHARLVE